MDRLFNAFDADKNGSIDFHELINGLSVFIRGTGDEKTERKAYSYSLSVTFKLFDVGNQGGIDPVSVTEAMTEMVCPSSPLLDSIRICINQIKTQMSRKWSAFYLMIWI